MEGGGVQVPSQSSEGFFHMPKLQVPSYQKTRVFVPFNQGHHHFNPRPPFHNQAGAQGDPAAGGTRQPGHVYNATKFSGGGPANENAGDFDGRRIRKNMVRKTVDYNSSVIKYLENRIWQRDGRDSRAIQPDALYQFEMTPPVNMQHKPMNCLTSKFMRQSTNKFRCPIFCISWTPEGRRLVTGASSGEFTLWNGLTFSFETILQAHETSVRAMVWSHNDQWMITGDHAGFIKYWQTNMNNVKMYQGHKEPVRSISFCPTDSKFVSSSDDGTVRVWDFLRCYEEKILRGHGADVKCVDWHPSKSLVASGSKDNQVPIKLWDPKSGTSLATLHAHKFTVMDLKWNRNGNWLLTAARDHLMKLFDIRNLKEELQVFKGHKKEATAIAWHPINEQMFASGGSDGAVMFWEAGTEKEVGNMEEAHDAIIWDLAWHPLGHVLASSSNDHSTKFFTRNRPGDAMRDKYNLNIAVLGPDGEPIDIDTDVPLGTEEKKSVLPGMGLEFGLPPEKEEVPEVSAENELPSIPGLDWSQDAEFFKAEQQQHYHERPRKKQPYSRPIPKSFEQAWITNTVPPPPVKEEPKPGNIKSLLSLSIPDKPPANRRASDGASGDVDDRHQQGDHGFQGDEDYRGDADFRQDEDMRDDQDFRGDTDFRGQDNSSGGGGRQGQFRGRDRDNQRGGGRFNRRDGRGRGRRGGRQGYNDEGQGHDDMDVDNYSQGQGDFEGNDDNAIDYGGGRDRGDRGDRDRDDRGPRGRGRRGQGNDGYNNRDRNRGNKRPRSSWNEDNSQGDGGGFNDGGGDRGDDDSFEFDSSRNNRNSYNNEKRGRGKFRGSDSYRGGGDRRGGGSGDRRGGSSGDRQGGRGGGGDRRGGGDRGGRGGGDRGGRGGGDRGGRGGRGGQKGNFRGDSRGGGKPRGRGRGNRGGN